MFNLVYLIVIFIIKNIICFIIKGISVTNYFFNTMLMVVCLWSVCFGPQSLQLLSSLCSLHLCVDERESAVLRPLANKRVAVPRKSMLRGRNKTRSKNEMKCSRFKQLIIRLGNTCVSLIRREQQKPDETIR